MNQNKKEQKTWITENIKELFDKRRRAKGTIEYPLIDKQVKKKCNEEYTKFLEVKFEEMEERLPVNPAEAHKRISELSGKPRISRRTSMIKDENGLLLLESSEVKERWQQYTKKLYDDPNTESMTIVFEELLTGPPMLKDEVWWAMKFAKKN